MARVETSEKVQAKASHRSYLLNTDGSGTGPVTNPSQGGVGIVLRDPEGGLLEQLSKAIGPATNTVAEYQALIEGLKVARQHAISRVRIFLDSELVVDQMNGYSRVSAQHLKQLHNEALSLLEQFPNRRVSWVPRKWNKDADALASAAAQHAAPWEQRSARFDGSSDS